MLSTSKFGENISLIIESAANASLRLRQAFGGEYGPSPIRDSAPNLIVNSLRQ